MVQHTKKPKRRIMRGLQLDEISAVDRPAQEGAIATILKRVPSAAATSIVKYYNYHETDEGAKPFSEVMSAMVEGEEQSEIMEVVGPAIYALEESLRSIAQDIDLTDTEKQSMMRTSAEEFLITVKEKWPEVEEEINKLVAEEDDMTETKAELQKQIDELTEKLNTLAATAGAGEGVEKVAELQAASEALTKKLEASEEATRKAEADRDQALALAKLSNDERAHYNGLSEDGDVRKDFLALDELNRDKAIAKASLDDETITIADTKIRKSVVGPEQFSVMKSQQERIDKQESDLEQERDLRKMAGYEKRAGEELEHLPGEVAEKASVLKAIDAMTKDDQKILSTMLAAGEKLAGSAFQTLGTGPSAEVVEAADTFVKHVDEIRARDKSSRNEAMAKARQEQPEAFKAYQEAGKEAGAAAH